MDSNQKKKPIEYFNFWQIQNKMTLLSLIAVLVLAALYAIGNVLLPQYRTFQFVAFIVLIPTFACFGIATCHASNLESAKAKRVYGILLERLSETESSQLTLDRFFSISSDLMAVAGKDGLLKKVSSSLINTLGYSEDVLLTTPFFEFIHPDDKEATRKNIDALNLGLRTIGFENRYRAADGNFRTLSWSAAADKELGVRFASARDVTEERNYQIRMQQIMDAAPFILMIKDIEGIITGCNAALAESLNVSKEQLLGQNAKNLMTAESYAVIQVQEDQVLKSQRPLSFDEVLYDQGDARTYRSTIFPIFDQAGKIVSVGKVSINIAGGNRT
ncbi:PAS domain-containing protein [Bdellovibrio sp. ZAP7]|uniref:PAS domain-containing protein n=1 Tax=Bdellovibrio sp. ZAP7 TaxID=2231053 RepID=UPI001FEF49E4|nr:PAS domain-containing protein [Bdellovibrio sp. ZAP7]